MFRSLKYVFIFLLILGGIVYLFNFWEHREEYEYLAFMEYDMFYDIDALIDWDAIDWDEVDIDLLEEVGAEEYFGLTADEPITTEASDAKSSFANSPSLILLTVCFCVGLIAFLKN